MRRFRIKNIILHIKENDIIELSDRELELSQGAYTIPLHPGDVLRKEIVKDISFEWEEICT